MVLEKTLESPLDCKGIFVLMILVPWPGIGLLHPEMEAVLTTEPPEKSQKVDFFF